MADVHTLIVGGGITGLSAAYEMVRNGVAPVLVESATRLGGVVQTDVVDGCVIEGGPDSFLSAKPAANELIRELGLDGDLISSNDSERVTYVVKNRRLVPLPDGLMMMVPTRILPMITTPLLSWRTKRRMAREYFYKPEPDAPERTVADFICRHYGDEAVDYLAEPLLSGVYGGTVHRLSATAVLGRFVELQSKYGSLTKGTLMSRRKALQAQKQNSGPLFQTLKGGLAQLTGAVQKKIFPQTKLISGLARAMERIPQGYRVKVNDDWITTRRLILACPAWSAANLLRGVQGELSSHLQSIEYSSSVTLALIYRKADLPKLPRGFGFLVPDKERKMLVACTFVGAKFPFRVPDTHVVLRCFLGGAGRDDVLGRTDSQILTTVKEELAELLSIVTEPADYRISRWPRSMAQYTVGHDARMARIAAAVAGEPGLYLAGNAYSGIGVPDCIRTGRAAARKALGQLS